MSNLINKVKEALTGEPQPTHATTGHTVGTAGTTGTSGTMGTAGTAHTTGTTGTTGNTYNTGTTGTAGGTYAAGSTGTAGAGPHNSSLLNKLDPRVDSTTGAVNTGSTNAGNTYSTGTTGTTTGTTMGTAGTAGGYSGSTNDGPHSSNLANKLDLTVDSNLDGRGAGYGTTTGGGTVGAGHTGNAYTTGTSGTTRTTGTTAGVNSSTGAGPHSSSLLNKLDPRVDSATGAVRTGNTNTGNTYTTGTTGTTGTAGGFNNATNAGPHSSNLANKIDPTVDSNLDGRGAGYGATTGGGMLGAGSTRTGHTHTTGTTGTTVGGLSNSTNAGPHDSNLANKLDPRVDSDLDGRGNRHGAATGGVFGASGSHATPGRGTAQNTAGPHNSDLLNKVDPRVDSNMDGSGTVGVNRTHAGIENKDPLNAAHVPPSVLRESLGDPVIAHDNPQHDHQGRHASMSHQEAHLTRGSETI